MKSINLIRPSTVIFVLSVTSTLVAQPVGAQQLPEDPKASESQSTRYVFQDPTKTFEDRLDDLMGRLSYEEKIGFLIDASPPIERLQIRRYNQGNEALHGIVRPGKFTVFPQAIALASTWNPALVERTATAISDEARGKYNATGGETNKYILPGGLYNGLLSFWSPTVNMARDPRWGRTQETYGEDPYLTSQIGLGFVRGLQGNHPKYLKVAATPKHFVANNEEHNRFENNAQIDERSLREYYLPAFKALLTEGRAASLMASYNAINGVPANANEWLLTDLARKEWGWDGYVVSDCGAISNIYDKHNYVDSPIDAAAAALNAGVDLECGTWGSVPYVYRDYLYDALRSGAISKAAIDRATRRVLKARFQLGLFDPQNENPYADIPGSVVASPKHQKLAREVAQQSIVLLQNYEVNGRRLLPIDRNSIQSIAVVGPNAGTAQFGGYSGTPANPAVSPADGLTDRSSHELMITHVPWHFTSPEGERSIVASEYLQTGGYSGITSEFFDNQSLEGDPATTRVDGNINFNWSDLEPDEAIPSDRFSVRWTGKIAPPISGEYKFIAQVSDGVRLYIDDELVIDDWHTGKELGVALSQRDYGPWQWPIEKKEVQGGVELTGGRTYNIRMEYFCSGHEAYASLSWIKPEVSEPQMFADSIAAAKSSDLVIAVLGLGENVEREGLDRLDLNIPARQQRFLEELRATNERLVVVLINGSPLSIPWMKKNIPAIVEAWYPGEQGGNAIADVIFGNTNPSGRLPVTFYESVEQLPPFDDYNVRNGRTYMYLETEPVFPFGHGLSYTTFEYSDGEVVATPTGYRISGRITNTGSRSGAEIVQLYSRITESSVHRPQLQLVGFERIEVAPGESQSFEINVPRSAMSFFDEQSGQWRIEESPVEFHVGASSADIRLIVKSMVVQ